MAVRVSISGGNLAFVINLHEIPSSPSSPSSPSTFVGDPFAFTTSLTRPRSNSITGKALSHSSVSRNNFNFQVQNTRHKAVFDVSLKARVSCVKFRRSAMRSKTPRNKFSPSVKNLYK